MANGIKLGYPTAPDVLRIRTMMVKILRYTDAMVG